MRESMGLVGRHRGCLELGKVRGRMDRDVFVHVARPLLVVIVILIGGTEVVGRGE
jgi:hypothetical protein